LNAKQYYRDPSSPHGSQTAPLRQRLLESWTIMLDGNRPDPASERYAPGAARPALRNRGVLRWRGSDGLEPTTDHRDDPRDLLELLGLDGEPVRPVGRRLSSINSMADCPFSTSNWTRRIAPWFGIGIVIPRAPAGSG
jgi:hypothetical protein